MNTEKKQLVHRMNKTRSQLFSSVDVSVCSVLNPVVVALEDVQGNDSKRGLIRSLEVNARRKSGLE